MTFIKKTHTAQRMAACAMAAALAVIVAAGVSSCESVSCPLNNTVESVYTFYASSRDASGTLVDGQAISVGDTLTVKAVVQGRDTTLVNRVYNKSGISLPVSYYADVDTLVFSFTDTDGLTATDTVWMSKQSRHHFDDPSCPVHMFHNVTAVSCTHQVMDTIVVVNAQIDYDGLENFQIYFYTDESE